MKAVRCPICVGTGTYWEVNHDASPPVGYYRTCHGCEGKGWVEVHEEEHNKPWYPAIIPSGDWPAYYPGEDWPEPFYITGDITMSMGDPATG